MKTKKGDTFFRLKVLSYSHNKKYYVYLNTRCKCGSLLKVREDSLLSGNTKSCGCLASEMATLRFTKHGMSPSGKTTRTYASWSSMVQRCTNPKNKAYKKYGGRGIKICGKWKTFLGFYKDMGERSIGDYSLDRINNDGNYCKSNCRWATRIEQANNKSTNVKYKGETAKEASVRLGGGRGLVAVRIKKGWDIKTAFTHPLIK